MTYSVVPRYTVTNLVMAAHAGAQTTWPSQQTKTNQPNRTMCAPQFIPRRVSEEIYANLCFENLSRTAAWLNYVRRRVCVPVRIFVKQLANWNWKPLTLFSKVWPCLFSRLPPLESPLWPGRGGILTVGHGVCARTFHIYVSCLFPSIIRLLLTPVDL